MENINPPLNNVLSLLVSRRKSILETKSNENCVTLHCLEVVVLIAIEIMNLLAALSLRCSISKACGWK
ncbi:hypothetical protein Syun_010287 [Stephania yunnanensis]|uniref:Uncharacterized protein n=1 Tax=Stephania yunnanensis TaxID=152371 RepID=A0AAP0KG82_9MAGN